MSTVPKTGIFQETERLTHHKSTVELIQDMFVST